MKKYRLGFIGTGARSAVYSRHYAPRDDMEIVAIADPNPHNRKAFLQITNVPNPCEEYDDWREMFAARTDLDGMVICSPNHVHADQAVACLERGLPILLEKPIAITKSDCERIIAAERANGGRALIGFVLRSTPFYATIHRLLRENAIGPVYSIEADELIGLGVTSIINRSEHRRHRATYGSVILSKCCHDLDILNWLMGCRPVAVNSFGRRNMFNPNPSLPETCDECGQSETCLYHKDPPMGKEENAGDAVTYRFMRDNNRCVYNIDKDIMDTQALSIEYENGATANFTMMMNCRGPRSGRNIHVLGMNGRVWGEFAEAKVQHYDTHADTVTPHDCAGDGSGHGGGDRALALELLTMMQDPDYRPAHSARAAYESALACFAADLSRIERRRVNISYDEKGFARFS